MNLVFTGFMGTGKSAAGKIAAGKLGYFFVDTDDEIEKKIGLSINSIFEKFGENYFRNIESEIVDSISKNDRTVVSCGGGVVLNLNNIEKLRENGIIISLYASPDSIFKRLENNGDRPLLKSPDSMEKIKKLLEMRKEFYKNCDLSFSTDNLTPIEVANIILNNKEIVRILNESA